MREWIKLFGLTLAGVLALVGVAASTETLANWLVDKVGLATSIMILLVLVSAIAATVIYFVINH